jgi:Mn-containing catalase
MFLRIDRLQIELPLPAEPAPNAAAALQELLGGKYGEMSTLGNYLFQSFNFRSKSKLKPFYGLVANITAEELGHVELVSNGVALLNNGPGAPDDVEADISNAPFADMKDIRLAASFLSNAGGAMPMNSNGASWNMDFVTNLLLDFPSRNPRSTAGHRSGIPWCTSPAAPASAGHIVFVGGDGRLDHRLSRQRGCRDLSDSHRP